MEVIGQLHAPADLPPRERAPGNHWIGDWMDPRTGLNAVVRKKKIHTPSGNPTPVVHPVA